MFRFFSLAIFLLSILFCEKTYAVSCEVFLTAQTQWNVVKSPNFPNQFAPQTQCNWLIEAPPGYRIELKFDIFYLMEGPKKRCINQMFKMTDMYSRVTAGPYCGNTPLPQVVSTGGSIGLTLESDSIGINLFYQGFKAQYRKSKKVSSSRLRDARGKWRFYSVQGEVLTTTTALTTTTIATRDPNEVDDNNNAAIDAQNNAINNNNVNNNELVNMKNNALNIRPTPKVKLLTTTTKQIIRFRTLRKTTTISRLLTRKKSKPSVPKSITTTLYSNRNGSAKEKEQTFIIEVVVGVALFLIILLAVVFFLLCRNKKSKKKKKKNHNITAKKGLNSKASATNPHRNHHELPQIHANFNYHQRTKKDPTYSMKPSRSRSNDLKRNHHNRPRQNCLPSNDYIKHHSSTKHQQRRHHF